MLGTILRLICCVVGVLLALPQANAGTADPNYPNKPIKMIVPWPPGASTDAAGRIIGDRLSQAMGQPVVVENRPGASGMIGTGLAAKSPADGYTLLVATADTHSINPFIYKTLPYDAVRSFEPIALFATATFVWIARPDLPGSTMTEALAQAKAGGKPLTFASWGVGSTAHLAGALLEASVGAELKHVPFTGAGPAMNALLGGHVDMMPHAAIVAEQLQQRGKVKILGTAGAARAKPYLPNVPTLAEQGIRNAEAASWYGLMAPAGLPADVHKKLSDALGDILTRDEVGQKIAGVGLDPVTLRDAEFQAFIQRESRRFEEIVKRKAIRVEQ